MSGIREPNFKPKTIWTGDNLLIMRGMNSACVDVIYFDPPFNSKKKYDAPIGSKAEGATFNDIWTLSDIDEEWIDLITDKYPKLHRVLLAAMTNSDKSYLTYMAPRILEMRRMLKDGGSIYLHCDTEMSHYLKLMMDAIFGRKNLRNEILWCYTGPGSPHMRQFNRKHDSIFWYSKGDTWTFNKDKARAPYKDPKQKPRRAYDTGGAFEEEAIEEMRERGKIRENWWSDIALAVRSKKENLKYPTQKPIKLLNRIIDVGSNPGDLVFDPFCGCATTLAAADDLQRDWVGIDISPRATDLIKMRIEDQQGLYRDIIERKDIPQRTDLGKLPPPRSNFDFLYGKQKGRCKGCKDRPDNEMLLEVDHIISKKKGGTDHIDNLQLLCRVCNNMKRDKSMEYLTNKLKKLGIGVNEDEDE